MIKEFYLYELRAKLPTSVKGKGGSCPRCPRGSVAPDSNSATYCNVNLVVPCILDKPTGQSDHELSTDNTDVGMSKKKNLPECKHQTEFKRLKVPPVDPKIWDKVNYVLLFIGYFRSGHSLVSSLLDAHPNIVISDEHHVVRMWRTLPEKRKTRDHLFQTIYEQSYKQAVVGQRSTKNCYPSVNYKYQVPNQYQGRFDKFIQVRNKFNIVSQNLWQQLTFARNFCYIWLWSKIKFGIVSLHHVMYVKCSQS